MIDTLQPTAPRRVFSVEPQNSVVPISGHSSIHAAQWPCVDKEGNILPVALYATHISNN